MALTSQGAVGLGSPILTLTPCPKTQGGCGVVFSVVKVCASSAGFNSLVGGVMGFSILLSAEVFKHNAKVWYLDGSIGVLIGLTIFAYGVK